MYKIVYKIVMCDRVITCKEKFKIKKEAIYRYIGIMVNYNNISELRIFKDELEITARVNRFLMG